MTGLYVCVCGGGGYWTLTLSEGSFRQGAVFLKHPTLIMQI